jgi:hypothetical protein
MRKDINRPIGENWSNLVTLRLSRNSMNYQPSGKNYSAVFENNVWPNMTELPY